MQAACDIKDYYLIGDQNSAALISQNGSIDWLCLPYFDSPSVFAKILDVGAGTFEIESTGFKVQAHYVAETAIAEFSYTSDDFSFTVRDFMVPADSGQYLVRKVTTHQGTGQVMFNYQPKPGYALPADPVISHKDDVISLKLETGWLRLHLPAGSQATSQGTGYLITISLAAEASYELILEYSAAARQLQLPKNLESRTTDFWERWVSKGSFFDLCRENLIRSAITLKLLQFAPTGAMVAAPTTSLPEAIGGLRNWDYRYVWIRDATFALYAFYVLGYSEEAEQFFDFIHAATDKCAENKLDIGLMYTIWGEPVPAEKTLDHLAGYQASSPVRVGNMAAEQLQLDVYGSLIDAYYFAAKRGLADKQQTLQRSRQLIMYLVKKIEESWRQPDSGIWEARSDPRQYIYSKVMCWVGVDRAQKLQPKLGLTDDDVQACSGLADTIKAWVYQHGFGADDSVLLQYPGAQTVDSTNFLLVLLQFLDKHDPRTRAIVDQTRQRLGHDDVFIYRYHGDDGLAGPEGAFVLSSFWLISALAILEDTNEALRLFRKLESYMAPSGLWAEEIDPLNGDYLGNYPQAFSHQGYIMSAYYLDKYLQRDQSLKKEAI